MPRAHNQTLPSLSSLPQLEIDPGADAGVLTSFAGLFRSSQDAAGAGSVPGVEPTSTSQSAPARLFQAQMVQSLVMLLAGSGGSAADIERSCDAAKLLRHQFRRRKQRSSFSSHFTMSRRFRARSGGGPSSRSSSRNRTACLLTTELISVLCSQMAHFEASRSAWGRHHPETAIAPCGPPGYQPMVARWAEPRLLCDEFR